MFWSSASDQGWGATVADHFAAGPWLEGEVLLSINRWELLAVERGLCGLQRFLQDQVVTVFSTTPQLCLTFVVVVGGRGGVFLLVLSEVAQRILHWAEL